MRSIFAYTGHLATRAMLKLPPLVFVLAGELRTMAWAELDMDAMHSRACPRVNDP